MAERISVVVPAYNAEPFLEETLRSILLQTFPVHECIVIDDGSTDGTTEVAQALGSEVRLHRQSNGGVASARNKGMQLATGNLVAFCDADDLWLPEKLERQLDSLRMDRNVSAAFVGVSAIDSSSNEIGELCCDSFDTIRLEDLLWHRQGRVPWSGPSALLCRKEVLDKVGLWDSSLSTLADWDYLIRLRHLGPFTGPSETLALYRRHDNAMSRDVDLLAADTRHLFEKLCKDRNLSKSPQLRRTLRGAKAWNYRVVAASYTRIGRLFRALVWGISIILTNPLGLIQMVSDRRSV